MTSVKTRQKEESRQKILKAASQLFREQGYEATGVDELMEKAGLTAGAFYAHFKSKKELLREAVRFGLEKNRGHLLQGTENMRGLELVEAVLARYVSEIHRDNPRAGCPLPAIGAEIHRSATETQELISAYLEEWIRIFDSALKGEASARRADALRLISQAVGAILLSRMTETSLSKEILRASRHVPRN
jgi:TetR/AcrR family transcriptional repressor of nem operon